MSLSAALEHHRAGRFAEALDLYAQALETDPNNLDLLQLTGSLACQLGQPDLAQSLLNRANQLAPGRPHYLNALGLAYRLKGQHGQAIACYMQVLTVDAHNASAYFGLGNAHQGLGQLDAAAAAFRRALALKPDFFEARYNLANLDKAAGRLEDALAHYRTVLDQQPDFADAQHNLGSTYYALGRLDEAMVSFQAALLANLPETHVYIGNIHCDRGEAELALACYARALRIAPGHAQAYNNMGSALRRLNRLDEARTAYRQAIQLDTEDAAAHMNLADLCAAQCDFAQAALHYEQAASLQPGQVTAWIGLGTALGMLNQLDAALAAFNHALALAPEQVDAHYNRGVILGRLEDTAGAEAAYRQVLALRPAHVNAHINLSAILADRGELAESRRHTDAAYGQQTLFEQPGAPGARSVLLLLDAGRGNINLTHLFPRETNRLYDWIIEYAPAEQFSALPHYDLVFNGMGDADVTRAVAEPVARFLATCNKPVLNPPNRVAHTARHLLPELLHGIEGMAIPPVWRLADASAWPDALAVSLPLLVRPVHTHGGAGMVLLAEDGAMQRYRATQSGPVYAFPFVDFKSADGWYRKYRVIFVDRVPYAYHLAISAHWLVHYVTADMQHDWKLAEERAFLSDPAAVLGEAGLRVIEAIAQRIDLDYAGIDFSVLPDGRILVFEANATMLVHPEDASGPLAHKNNHVARILDAFEAMLACRSGHPGR